MSQLARLIPTSGPGSGTVTSITFNGGLTSTPDPVTTTGTATIDQTNLTVLDGTVYWDTGTQLLHTTTTGSAGQVLTSNGVGMAPTYQNSMATSITYTADSGTAMESGGNINFLGGANISSAAAGSTVSYALTGTTNHAVQVGDSTGSLTSIAVGTTGQVLTGVTGSNPVFASPAASSITITGDSGGGLTGNSFTFTGGTTGLTFAGAGTTETLGGILVVANGGTGDSSFTAYAPIVGGTTTTNPLQSASTGQSNSGWVLTSTGAASLPTFQAPASSSISITGDSGGALTGNAFTFTGGTTGLTFSGAGTTETLTGTLVVANGGTGRATLTSHGLLVGAGTSAITQLAEASNGQLPIGSTGNNPVLATLSAGTGITIVNGAGSISISASGSGFTWNDVTGGSASMVAENGYVADSGSLTTLTMPTNNSLGDTIKVVGKGSGGWTIVTGLLQNIKFGSAATTATTGSLSSTNANDCLELVCTTPSITAPIFTVVSSIGNITVV